MNAAIGPPLKKKKNLVGPIAMFMNAAIDLTYSHVFNL